MKKCKIKECLEKGNIKDVKKPIFTLIGHEKEKKIKWKLSTTL